MPKAFTGASSALLATYCLLSYLGKNIEDNSQNNLVTLGSMLVKRRVGKPVIEDRPRSEATTSTSSTSSMTLPTTQES